MIVSKSTGKVFTGKVAALMLRIGVATETETFPGAKQIEEVIEAKDESVNENHEKVNEPEVENVEEITEEPVIEQQQITEEVIKQPESINAPEKKKGRPTKKVK